MQAAFEIPSGAARIAVAVSGGADSMALAHMLSGLGLEVHALVVDHGLRPESGAEAAQVAAWLSGFSNTVCSVLEWQGKKPVRGIQQAARAARYDLMARYCRDHGIGYLALAHHRDDQAETFFMRLTRGSGIDGLAAMRVLQPYDKGLTLWRPLLAGFSHDDLVAHCRAHGLPWVEDPTNANAKYTRNRLRELLRGEGLDARRIAITAQRMERASDALRILGDRLLQNALIEKDADAWLLNLNLLRNEPLELAVRVVRNAINALGHDTAYGARYDRIEDMTRDLLCARKATSVTLGGCVMRVNPKKSTLLVMAESRWNQGKSLPRQANGL